MIKIPNIILLLLVCLVTVAHADLHDDIWRNGKEYGDADTIEIDDDGGYYTGDNVEEALQEIGNGSIIPPTSPGGSDTYVQFNDSDSFGGDAELTYDKNTDILTSGAFVTTGSVTAGTVDATTITATGTVQGEQITSTDDINATDTITGATLTDGTLSINSGSITSAVNGTFSGTVQAEQLTTTDDAEIGDDLKIIATGKVIFDGA